MNNYNQTKRGAGYGSAGRWEIVGLIFYPIFFYQMLSVLLILLGKAIFGVESSDYMACQTLMAAVSIPVMYYVFLRSDLKNLGTKYFADYEQQNNYAREILVSRTTKGVSAFRRIVMSSLIAVLIGTGLNNMILMSSLAEKSTAYQQTAETFYSGGVMLELVCSGILIPILEEIVYRGVLYGRMRRFAGPGRACFLSAFVFGLLHFNLVQFVYAMCMGIVFVVILEKTGKLYCVMAAHMAVNLLAVIRTETGLFATTMDGSLFAWITSAAFLVLGLLFLYFFTISLVKDIREMIAWESANGTRGRRLR